jgi:hypothetical protein
MSASDSDSDADFNPDREFPIAPPAPRKGRGAVTNLQGRYEVDQRETVDDGWASNPDEDGEPRALRTQVFEEKREDHPDAQFVAGHSVQCVAEPVSRLRTRLYILLRAPDA